MILFHGSEFKVEKPLYNYGKKTNDYGQGFYCTEDFLLACEWASNFNRDGFTNVYSLDTSNLKILNLDDYNILYWITILIENRTFEIKNNIAKRGMEYLKKNYSLDLSGYDLIIGYRADDSHFTFAKDFLNNTISLERLENAMKLGNLGKQVVLKSEKAFNEIKYLSSSFVKSNAFYNFRKNRNEDARKKYFEGYEVKERIYLIDIMRGDFNA